MLHYHWIWKYITLCTSFDYMFSVIRKLRINWFRTARLQSDYVIDIHLLFQIRSTGQSMGGESRQTLELNLHIRLISWKVLLLTWLQRKGVKLKQAFCDVAFSRVTLYTAGHLHTAVPHCSHSHAPIVHTAVHRENNEHGCVYLRCRAVCKLPGCVEGHPWFYTRCVYSLTCLLFHWHRVTS